MRQSDSVAILNTQRLRICYVAAPTGIDLSTITELLAERQMQPILSADLSSTASTFLEGLVNAISNADLFIAILGSNLNNDQIYIELGIAIAKERRILVLVSPGALPTLDISEIPSIRTDATNRDAISFILDQVLETPPRKYRAQLPSSTPQKSQPIGDLADDLLAQLEAPDKHITATRNKKNVFETEEVDICVYNVFSPGGLPSPAFPPWILIECKNWSHKVSSSEVSWFDTKLRDRGLSLGILIATQGITGDSQRLTDAHFIVAKALSEQRKIIVITRKPYQWK